MIEYRGYLLADLGGKSERRWAIFLPPSCIPKEFASNHVEACRKVDGMIDNASVTREK